MKFRLIHLLIVTSLGQAGMSFAAFPLVAPPEARTLSVDEPWPLSDTIRVCAIRVEFQPDAITGTSGTGLMADASLFPDSLHFDPLPHDSQYFADHLALIADYFRVASHEHLHFGALEVYPPGASNVLRLNHPMWHYNYNTDQDLLNSKLVELFVHAIWKADSAGIPLDQYDAFVIFHAGVGKDFSFGYDATPFDIPSAFISENDLLPYRSRLPAAVTSGLLLPEAENQQEALDYGIELSLNGISVKLFGNWLGLPDLFDTETGRSGIGRWGMMDQGSGNLNALVPALPDAWSRLYMGWDTPEIVIPGSDTAAAITTQRIKRTGSAGDLPEIIKLPVTPTEYYLLENRDADADSIGHVSLFDRDGRELQMDRDGNLAIQTGFRVAVRASHYDYGIPGSGLLIWHIDEEVIEVGLPTNRVNADREHRGVDLVEADGAQDIGREYGFASSGSGTELGIQEDAWWGANADHKAANGGSPVRFTDRSHPSTKLYDGSYTYLELTNFSDVADTMSFRARLTYAVPGYPVEMTASEQPVFGYADFDGDGYRELVAQSGRAVRIFSFGGESLFSLDVPDGMQISSIFAEGQDLDGDGLEELLFTGDRVGYLQQAGSGYELLSGAAHRGYFTEAFPCSTATGVRLLLEAGMADGSEPDDSVWIKVYDSQMNLLYRTDFGVFRTSQIRNIEAAPATRFALSTPAELKCVEVTDTGLVDVWANSSLIDDIWVLNEPAERFLYSHQLGYLRASDGVLVAGPDTTRPPRIDWDGDGICEGGGRFGESDLQGEDLPGMPLDTDTGSIEDLDADGKPDILALRKLSGDSSRLPAGCSRMSAFEHSGRSFDGFPLAAHQILTQSSNGFDLAPDNNLFFVSMYRNASAGTYQISLNKLPILARDNLRFKYTAPANIITVGPLRPQVHARADWVYCWPNPAREVSYIRVTRSDASQTKVKLFDLAGRMVAELSGSSGMAGQYEIPWDVTNVESGVYIGSVEVRGSGSTERKEIKIAVVK
ncbi:T9SS type A sorting domain-containing protein [candidate division KSB1 bacterium]|nr:T9SS type A sorting domain-containing protein [candidate division KSB1 bacterium]